MDDELEELTVRLRAFLRTSSYTQPEFALEAGVGHRTVGELHRGEYVGRATRRKVSEALDRLEPLTDTGDPTSIGKIARLEERVARLEAAIRELTALIGDDGQASR